MKDESQAALTRRTLDEGFRAWRRVSTEAPKRGWIAEIREALGMTCGDLALRLGVTAAAISMIEKAEATESIKLKSLRRAAKALDCTLVYALVPRRPLEKIIEHKRRRIAAKDLASVLSAKPIGDYRALIAAYAQTVKRKRLWRSGV